MLVFLWIHGTGSHVTVRLVAVLDASAREAGGADGTAEQEYIMIVNQSV